MFASDTASAAVVRVGAGRGFIVQVKHRRMVVTAAHCLPHLPPCHGASYTAERTYANLLGPLRNGDPAVWAECLFADPVTDVAVLGTPDDQALCEQSAAYDALVDAATPMRIADAPPSIRAWLLSLAGTWHPCTVTRIEDDHPVAFNGPLWIEGASGGIHGGMSGSPIVADDGAAIGIVCLGDGADGATGAGPNPRLVDHLPGWMLR